ncbi:pentatricopeptide repeat-containing protein [Hordeum vulgare]|nr:pentatricopeptide repeat-containing protein [Hordeum vulgare]
MELCCSGVVSGGGGAAGAGTLRAQKSRNPPGFLLSPPRRRPSSRAGCRQLASPSYDERVGRPGDAGSVVHMLRSAAAADPAEALELFLYVARQTRVVDTTGSCNYTLELMRTHGRVGDVAHVLDILQRQIVKANVGTFCTVFGPVGVEGGLQSAPAALPVMKEARIALNAYTYNGFIYFLVKSGFDRETMEVYNAMAADGVVPTVRTYSVLMLTFGKRRDTETVVGLLGEMDARGVRPNVYNYTICIRVFGQARRLEEAYRILCKMKEEGCKPDVVTNTVLIQILCDAGQLDDAKDVFWKMKASDQKPDRVTYTTILDKCGNDGDSRFNRSLELVNHMNIHGPTPNGYTHVPFINYHGKSGESLKALKRYELMKSKGIVPDVVAGNAVLYGLAKSGRLGMAKRVFHELKAMGISPDNITYTMMIRCCSKASNVDEAMKIFAEMIENRRLPCSLIDMMYKAWEMKPRIFYELKERTLNPLTVLTTHFWQD